MTDRPQQAPSVPAAARIGALRPQPAAHPPTQAGPDKVRCVLWHAPGESMPGDLLSTLSKRIGHFSFVTDAYAALAAICALERDRRLATAQAASDEPHPASLLVIIEPATLGEAAQVIEAVRMYAPGATLRQYRRSANPRFSPIVETVVPTATPIAPSPVVVVQASPPPLRLTREHADGAGAANGHSKPAAPQPPAAQTPAQPERRTWTAGVQLSEEELRMLLSDEPDLGAGGRS